MTTTDAPPTDRYTPGPSAMQELRTRALISAVIDERLAQLVAASLPGLDVPDDTRFEAPSFDGVWRECTPQEALLAAGHGRPYRVVLTFPAR